MTRYATGLIGSFLVFGAACAAGLIPVMLFRGRPDRIFEFLPMWVTLGPLSIVGIALVIGPAVLGVTQLFKGRVSVAAAVSFGAVLGPALLFFSWLLFRESNETFRGLLQFWVRVPGEFIVGALPNVAASAFFAGWLVAGMRRPRVVAA